MVVLPRYPCSPRAGSLWWCFWCCGALYYTHIQGHARLTLGGMGTIYGYGCVSQLLVDKSTFCERWEMSGGGAPPTSNGGGAYMAAVLVVHGGWVLIKR
ncbi:hypothetical protein T484DRAFT_1973237 [Baffinella frigidus]|nr:hypothetical protein T484DRAFT_1973237 [Cryptophyta sp. CCMP2293]